MAIGTQMESTTTVERSPTRLLCVKNAKGKVKRITPVTGILLFVKVWRRTEKNPALSQVSSPSFQVDFDNGRICSVINLSISFDAPTIASFVGLEPTVSRIFFCKCPITVINSLELFFVEAERSTMFFSSNSLTRSFIRSLKVDPYSTIIDPA